MANDDLKTTAWREQDLNGSEPEHELYKNKNYSGRISSYENLYYIAR